MTDEDEVDKKTKRIMHEVILVLQEVDDFDQVLQITMSVVVSIICSHMPKDDGLNRYNLLCSNAGLALKESYEEDEESKQDV